MTPSGQSNSDVTAWATALETAGLVQLRVDAGATQLATLLSPDEAEDVSGALARAAHEVREAAKG